MNFLEFLNEEKKVKKTGPDMSWMAVPKDPAWPKGHPNYKEKKPPRKSFSQQAGKFAKKIGKKAAKATGKAISTAGHAAGSALMSGFSKLFGFGKYYAQRKQKEARSQKRMEVATKYMEKTRAKRKDLAARLPKNMKRTEKAKILANIRGVRTAVRRWDDTQLTAMHNKHKGTDTPLAYSLKAELKARSIKKKRQAAKIDKTLAK
jgi:hypothetical protein